jgi:hypothetical protein
MNAVRQWQKQPLTYKGPASTSIFDRIVSAPRDMPLPRQIAVELLEQRLHHASLRHLCIPCANPRLHYKAAPRSEHFLEVPMRPVIRAKGKGNRTPSLFGDVGL